MTEVIDAKFVVFAHPDPADQQKLSATAARILTRARQLTSQEIVVLSPVGIEAEQIALYGATRIYQYEEPFECSWQVGSYLADALYALVQKEDPGVVLLPSAAWSKDATAHLATRLDSGGSVDITQLSVEDGKLTAQKAVLNGAWETKFSYRRGTPVIALRTAGWEATAVADPVAVEVIPLQFTCKDSTAKIKVVENKPSTNLSTLAEATVAVCAGRGVKGNLDMVYQLAEKLGGAVGATRVACEEGWIERSAQVGQSGVSIAPSLYIGLGISGDPHHVAGIRGAKTIVAVTNDSEAPIFELADFGVVGDCEEVVKQALENL